VEVNATSQTGSGRGDITDVNAGRRCDGDSLCG